MYGTEEKSKSMYIPKNHRSNDSVVKQSQICLFDVLNYFNIRGHRGPCNRYPNCPYYHFNHGPGPTNTGYGWKTMTKNEIFSNLPKDLDDEKRKLLHQLFLID